MPNKPVARAVRCAIYTRKSTDEGLEQEFNSLDNQYLFCKNYIEARKPMGLEAVSVRYDDGGFSGGNVNRPAFQRLLADVKAGLVDRIVVYKIDRLTRSTLDFAHIYEILKQYNVGFVSVTEEMFDTTTPTGMLIINVFISFAQYERELTGQRIRDKVSSSKALGIFMGGIPPFGYDIGERKLLINQEEGRIVNLIYDRFLETHSICGVVEFLNSRNFKTKSYISRRGGRKIVGKSFSTQVVLRVLKNPLYYGKVKHKGNIYDGQHEAIIDEARWQMVQNIFSEHKVIKKRPVLLKQENRKNENSLLQGVVCCGHCGYAMIPTYTCKKNLRYRYYICSAHSKKISGKCPVKRVPARQIENLVVGEIVKMFKTKEFFMKYMSVKGDFPISEACDLFQNIERIWDRLFEAEKFRIIRELVKKVAVHDNRITIEFYKDGLLGIFKELLSTNDSSVISYREEPQLVVDIPIVLARGFQHAKLINVDTPSEKKRSPRDLLLEKLAEAYSWRNEHLEFDNPDFNGKKNLNRNNIRKTFRLNQLAPDIVEAVLDGRMPDGLNYSSIVNNPMPLLWSEQRKLYGFNERKIP